MLVLGGGGNQTGNIGEREASSNRDFCRPAGALGGRLSPGCTPRGKLLPSDRLRIEEAAISGLQVAENKVN